MAHGHVTRGVHPKSLSPIGLADIVSAGIPSGAWRVNERLATDVDFDMGEDSITNAEEDQISGTRLPALDLPQREVGSLALAQP